MDRIALNPKNIVLLAVPMGMLFCGCDRGRTYPSSATFTERAKLTEVTENFVKVALSLESDSAGQPVIRATFTPTQQGLHLYSKDLPEKGVKGFGVPTRLDLVAGAIKPAGPIFSDQTPYDLKISDLRLPIYPEGPVTLRQPIEIVISDDLSAQVEISYMACRTGGECKIPVQRKRVQVKLPRG